MNSAFVMSLSRAFATAFVQYGTRIGSLHLKYYYIIYVACTLVCEYSHGRRAIRSVVYGEQQKKKKNNLKMK